MTDETDDDWRGNDTLHLGGYFYAARRTALVTKAQASGGSGRLLGR